MPQYASLRGKLVLKTVIYISKLLDFQNFACLPCRIPIYRNIQQGLKLEHYESDKSL